MAKTPASSPDLPSTTTGKAGETHQTALTLEGRLIAGHITSPRDLQKPFEAIRLTPQARPLLDQDGVAADSGVTEISIDARAWLQPDVALA